MICPLNISLDPTAKLQLDTVGEITNAVGEYQFGAAGQLYVEAVEKVPFSPEMM